MKKFLLSCLVILSFSAYVIIERLNSTKQAIATTLLPPKTNQPLTNPSSRSSTSSPSSSLKSSAFTSTPYSSSKPTSSSYQNYAYKDGQFTGSSADAYYGNVQVKATIENGKITDIQFLDYPHDRNTSVAINDQAISYLKQEAIQAQSAQVDIVSGATLTSEAFQQSLQNVLNQAR